MREGALPGKNPWLRHGFWNTLEHGLTRVADASTTIVLLWWLPTEVFSRLVLAQAWVGLLLLLFVSPETAIYRDYASWRAEGVASLRARVRALRWFGWSKVALALGLSAVVSHLVPWGEPSERFGAWSGFCVFAWAFSFALAPQIAGIDREWLRLSLRLRELSAVSLFQKSAQLVGTIIAAVLHPGSFAALAVAALAATMTSALVFAWRVERALALELASAPEPARALPSAKQTIHASLTTFSAWQHVSGALGNWVQTMDVFVLGWFGAAPRTLGIYGAVLKLANLTNALPSALGNLFQIWLGRRADPGSLAERRELRRLTTWLALGAFAQAALIVALAPWIVELLSHGRWDAAEQVHAVAWMRWMVSGVAMMNATLLPTAFLMLRGRVRRMLFTLYLPWTVVALVIYTVAADMPDGIGAVAFGNLAVAVAYALLLWRSK